MSSESCDNIPPSVHKMLIITHIYMVYDQASFYIYGDKYIVELVYSALFVRFLNRLIEWI